jgi:hypothetical protein
LFKALKMINTLHLRYGVIFTDILSDNGAELALTPTSIPSRPCSSNTSFITTNAGPTKRLPVKPPSRLLSSSHQN